MASFFPSTATQATVATLYILSISILAQCLSHRVSPEDLGSWESLKQITWPRLCIILVFLDSWLFLVSSNVIIYGIGLETHETYCSSAIYLCIFFYATSKFLTYFFLIEKVHVVWSPNVGAKRLKSTMWISSAIIVSLYGIVIAAMLFGRIHYLRPGDSVCVIGLKAFSDIPLLAYDVFINLYLTTLFLWPLLHSKLSNPRIRRVATRTLAAAAVSLTTSTVNISLLAKFQGHELGWVCLGLCGGDILINALALFWVTHSTQGNGRDRSADEPPRLSNVTPKSTPVTTPRKSTFFDGISPAASPRKEYFDYLASPSRPRFNLNEVSVVPSKSLHHKAPSVVQKVAKLFRSSSERSQEEHDLQVTVTQEFDVEVHVDVSSEHSNPERPSTPDTKINDGAVV